MRTTLVAELLIIVVGAEGVVRATVDVDKPHAVRFADSVAVVQSACRDVVPFTV